LDVQGGSKGLGLYRANGFLTAISPFNTVVDGSMRTRVASLILLLVLGSGSFVGMPMHSNEQSCSMGGAMGEMDCCKVALSKHKTRRAAAARICCSLNCSQNGTTPSNNGRTSPQSHPASSADYLASTPAIPASALLTRHIRSSHGPPTDSHPAYIRHLALLI